jgi:hypothetical protein
MLDGVRPIDASHNIEDFAGQIGAFSRKVEPAQAKNAINHRMHYIFFIILE